MRDKKIGMGTIPRVCRVWRTMRDKKIGVLMGGISAERGISLKTGEAVLRALKEKGYQAVGIDVDSMGGDCPRFTDGAERSRRIGAVPPVCTKLITEDIEVVFICLHGRYGEDGTIQGFLEIMGIPYTGSGVTASALAMNKVVAKRLFRYQGIPTPPYRVLSMNEGVESDLAFMQQPLKQGGMVERLSSGKELKAVTCETPTVLEGSQCKCNNTGLLAGDFPVVVKPPSEGSTIGVRVVYDEDELREAIDEASVYSPHILIERFVDGSEFTVGIIEGELLPTIEIVPKKGFYDYTSKYTPGMTEYLIPTSLDEETDSNVQRLALKAYRTLGCRGSARVDMIVDRDRTPWVLEVNTIPGMTETSLLPRSAKAVEIPFDSLVEKILLGARLGD